MVLEGGVGRWCWKVALGDGFGEWCKRWCWKVVLEIVLVGGVKRWC